MRTKNEMQTLMKNDYAQYAAEVKKLRQDIDLLEKMQEEDLNAGFGPNHTVESFISAIGEDAAAAAIASLIDLYKWDGRIDPANKTWANGVSQAYEGEAVRSVLYTKMHRAHLDQIAYYMRMWQREMHQQ